MPQPFHRAHVSMIDSHAHIDHPSFDADREQVLQRARDAGVNDIVVPATTAASWSRIDVLCAAHPVLHPAFGLHPMFLAAHAPDDLDHLPAWLEERHAVAVGECGLDFFIADARPDQQRACFTRQLAIARELDLPVIIHARRAVEEVIHTLRRYAPLSGVVHSFSGSHEQARQLADLGFMIGIGGPVTHARATRLQRTVANIPLDTLLLETDSPDQPGALHRGTRNEPAWLVDVVRAIAALRAEDEHTIDAATTANARRLFGLP